MHLTISDIPDWDGGRRLTATRGARSSGSVIYGTLTGDPRRGYIHGLFVELCFRRQGIASALMEEAEKRLREMGYSAAFLYVAEDNTARALYERRGYVIESGEYKPIINGSPGICYVKSLVSAGLENA